MRKGTKMEERGEGEWRGRGRRYRDRCVGGGKRTINV
jgi:hypothetical protein